MRYLLNILKSISMIINSISLGNSFKDIKNLIKFLSSDKKDKLVLNLSEMDSNYLVNDIKSYINKYGHDIGILKEIQFTRTKSGTFRYTKLTLYKQTNREELLRIALEPYIERRHDKIINIDDYKRRDIAVVV